MPLKRALARPAVVLSLVLSGLMTACGFHPLYGERSQGALARLELAAVQIDLIRDREGQMLRNALLDRFQPAGAAPKALYTLSIGLKTQHVGLAVRPDETGSRANLIMTADFAVREIGSGAVVFNGHSRSITGYNILNSEFATTSSEADAVRRAIYDLTEQITTRVSVSLSERKSDATARP